MSESIKYQDALTELQAIIESMESGKIPVDQLSAKVKRASELIKVCKRILSTAEEDVSQILKELESMDQSKVQD